MSGGTDRNLYEACTACDGTGRVTGMNSHGYLATAPCVCRLVRVVETGFTVGQMDRFVLAERIRLGNPAALKGEDRT